MVTGDEEGRVAGRGLKSIEIGPSLMQDITLLSELLFGTALESRGVGS